MATYHVRMQMALSEFPNFVSLSKALKDWVSFFLQDTISRNADFARLKRGMALFFCGSITFPKKKGGEWR